MIIYERPSVIKQLYCRLTGPMIFPWSENFVLTTHSFCLLMLAWQQHDVQELCRVMFDALESKFKNTDQVNVQCISHCKPERNKAEVTYFCRVYVPALCSGAPVLFWSPIDQMTEDLLGSTTGTYLNKSLRLIFVCSCLWSDHAHSLDVPDLQTWTIKCSITVSS